MATKKKAAKKTAGKPVKKAAKKPVKKSVRKPGGKKPAKKKASSKTAALPAKRVTLINPYLTFNGNCEDAFNFYKSVFGGEFVYLGRFKDMPVQEGKTVSETEASKIMHVSLPISGSSILMGSDASSESGQTVNMGDNISISIATSTKAEADRIFNSLSAGGRVTMPMSSTFWGSYFGMFTDKFGIHWMIALK